MQVFTGKGDDGTTGLYYGGRVLKNDPKIAATGSVDEAQAAIGFARAGIRNVTDTKHDADLIRVERDLWILMAEINADEASRDKLEAGKSLVTADMVLHVEALIAHLAELHEMPSEFVVPGQDERSARLDLARVAVRRAERETIGLVPDNSHVIAYLNRLSSYLWALARFMESSTLLSKEGN